MHDNAPVHTAIIVRRALNRLLERMGVELMEWPP